MLSNLRLYVGQSPFIQVPLTKYVCLYPPPPRPHAC